jgi:dnd system-associated protein 4
MTRGTKDDKAPRVRRDKSQDDTINRLLKDGDGPFDTIAEVLVFAAAYGYRTGRREAIKKSGEPIRWDTISGVGQGVDEFVGMLAVASSDEREIVNPDRLKERIEVFEEFANGGLKSLGKELSESKLLPFEVILQIVVGESDTSNEDGDPLGLTQLIK